MHFFIPYIWFLISKPLVQDNTHIVHENAFKAISHHSQQHPAADPPGAWLLWCDRSRISFSCSLAFSSSCPELHSHQQRTARKEIPTLSFMTVNGCLWKGHRKIALLTTVTVPYLVVGCVFFEMGFNTAAQLENPAPLSLQSCCEGLVWTKKTRVWIS